MCDSYPECAHEIILSEEMVLMEDRRESGGP